MPEPTQKEQTEAIYEEELVDFYHTHEIGSEPWRVQRGSRAELEEDIRHFYGVGVRGNIRRMNHGSELTPYFTNTLTVYEAVIRVLKDRGILQRQAINIRLHNDIPWRKLGLLIGRSKTRAHNDWREFIDSTVAIILPERDKA